MEILSQTELLKFGNELQISGVLFANGIESKLIIFPENQDTFDIVKCSVLNLDHEEWKKLLYQVDTGTVQNLAKIILRKSQRNIESDISWNVFRRDNYQCQYCGKNDIPLSVDHVILWEEGGASVEDNLISSCKKCNKTRGNMQFPEWLASEYFLKNIQAFDKPLEKIASLRKFYEKAQTVPKMPTKRNR